MYPNVYQPPCKGIQFRRVRVITDLRYHVDAFPYPETSSERILPRSHIENSRGTQERRRDAVREKAQYGVFASCLEVETTSRNPSRMGEPHGCKLD